MQISESALFSRIRRRLARDGQTLRTTRGEGWPFHSFGRHFVVDDDRNLAVATNVDPVTLGLELGVIAKGDIVVRPEIAALLPAVFTDEQYHQACRDDDMRAQNRRKQTAKECSATLQKISQERVELHRQLNAASLQTVR